MSDKEPFTTGKKQLEKVEVDWSRELSSVCIHVERIIGKLRQKYTILQGILQITYIGNVDEHGQATVDKLIKVCAALVNLCPPVVPQN